MARSPAPGDPQQRAALDELRAIHRLIWAQRASCPADSEAAAALAEVLIDRHSPFDPCSRRGRSYEHVGR
jgi:hypothetical protein